MTDEEIQQRIRYLVEFGGLCDDPLLEVRRAIRINKIITATAVALVLVDLVFELMRL